MIQDVIDCLAKHLNTYFPEYGFSDTQDIQGVEPPRFFITCYRSEVKPRITDGGFFYSSNFDLIFDPGEPDEQACYEIARKLVGLIRFIPRGDGKSYRADNLYFRYEASEKVLHVFFDVTRNFYDPIKERIPDIKHIQTTTTEKDYGNQIYTNPTQE